ncbi:MAG: MBL fold metallo-hydrolase, partial [Pseudomonadota bacterium]
RAVPGHGPVTVPWPEGGKILERYLEVLAADLRKAIADGMPMIEAITRMALSERAKWLLFDEFNPRNASTAYQELEWE